MEVVVKDNVINLNIVRANKLNDNTVWTPKDMLEDTLECIENGTFNPEKLMIAYISKEDEGTRTGYILANISQTELIGMLEKAKLVALGLYDG